MCGVDGMVLMLVYVDGLMMVIEGMVNASSGAAVRGYARWDARRLFYEVVVSV